MEAARGPVRRLWSWLRQVSGDAAYENYVRHASCCSHPAVPQGAQLLTRSQFYLDSLRRRYSTLSRCC